MNRLAPLCFALTVFTSALACTMPPGETACSLSAGNVSGSPSVELGTGAREFIPRANGDRWLAQFGPQGGAHLWLSTRTQGLGPRVDVKYQMTELDGGIIYDGVPVQLCLAAHGEGGQVTTGVQGFIDYTFPEPCSRILCGSTFRVSLTVSDNSGNSARDERVVNGVDIGDDLSATSPPDCQGAQYNPRPTCDGGLR